MDVFLLIGQSNMAGRGFLAEAIDVDRSRLFTFRNCRWQKLFRPINPDRSFSGVSLAERFAELYSKEHDVEVGLICCADGGTQISQWQPGEPLYENAVFQAKLAMQNATLQGILWHQGESDCSPDQIALYEDKLKHMIETLRQDLGMPDIPFIVGGLGDYLPQYPKDDDLKNYTQINAILKALENTVPQYAFVDATGLTSNPDYLHFNAASLYEFGQRYYDVFSRRFGATVSKSNLNTDLSRSDMELL